MPRVSVIIPALNAGEFIDDAIRSVLGQSSPDFELLLVDDGSDDDTLPRMEAFAACDQRVRVVSHDSPQGASAARNHGLQHATGDWIAFLDADDVWLTDSLKIRLAIAGDNPDCEFVVTDFIRRPRLPRENEAAWNAEDSNRNGFFRTREPPIDSYRAAFDANRYIRLYRPVSGFLVTNLACTDVAMVKRKLLNEIGGFDTSLQTGEDLLCWIRLAARTDVYFSPEITAIYRLRHGSLTQQEAKSPVEGGAQACKVLLKLHEMKIYRREIKRKMAHFYQQDTYFYRERRIRHQAFVSALRTCRADWRYPQALRNLAATIVGR